MKKLSIVLLSIFCFLLAHAQEAKLVIPNGHLNGINSIDISSDDKLIATGSRDNTVIIWDARTWSQLRTIDVNKPVKQVLFSKGAKFIIVVSGEGETVGMNFSMWSVDDGKRIKVFPFQGAADGSKISPDGKYLSIPYFTARTYSNEIDRLSTFNKDAVAIWDINNFKKLPFIFTLSSIGSFIFYRDNYYFITASQAVFNGKLNGGSYIDLWDLNNVTASVDGKKPTPLQTFYSKNEVKGLITSPIKNILATNCTDRVLLWNVETGSIVNEIRPKGNRIKEVTFSNDGKMLFVHSSFDKNEFISTYNLDDSSKNSYYILPHQKTLVQLYFSHNGNYFIKTDINDANIYDMQGNVIAILTGHSIINNSYVFSADGRYISTNYITKDAVIAGNRFSSNQFVDSISTSMITLLEETQKTGFTQLRKDSVIRQFREYAKADLKRANLLSQRNDRIWDLQYAKAYNKLANNINLTSDSISPNKKYKLTTAFGSTGMQNNISIISDISRTNKSYDIPILTDTGRFLYKMMNDKTGFVNKQHKDVLLLINNKTKDTLSLITLDSTDWIITSNDGYYTASKDAASLLHYAVKNEIVSFEQLDLKYNRPDKILEKIGYADKNLIEAYRNVYWKRIKRSNIDTTYFHDKFTVPQANITNKNEIAYFQKNEKLAIDISALDSKSKLKRFNVWVNHVPLYGIKGIDIAWHNKNQFDTSITITLSQGDNQIETSVLNATAIESYHLPIFIKYLPSKPKEEKIYFVGIGVDKFTDAAYNLQYCTKDVRDICIQLKSKYGNKLFIDTLFNEHVTLSNIQALKKTLEKSTVDDKIILAYSGHGLLSKKFNYFLSTYDINFKKPEENGLPYDELENLLDNIPARKKLMLIDACHSGEVDKDDLLAINTMADSMKLKKGMQLAVYKKEDSHLGMKNSFELMQSLFVNVGKSTGATIISAAAGTEFALEKGNLKNGVFTYCILEAMNNYATMKVSALKRLVSERVEQLTNGVQKPTFRNETVGTDWNVW